MLPAGLRGLLGVGLSLGLVVFTLYRLRARGSQDRLAALATLLAFTLVLRPAWVHYFAVLPLGQAERLGRERAGTGSLVLFALSAAASALPLLAFFVDRRWFFVGDRVGVITWSALLCLGGLLQLAAPGPARSAPAG